MCIGSRPLIDVLNRHLLCTTVENFELFQNFTVRDTMYFDRYNFRECYFFIFYFIFFQHCNVPPDIRFKFGRSNSHSHSSGKTSKKSTTSPPADSGTSVCHKSLPDLHTSARRRASLSPRASTKSTSKPTGPGGVHHQTSGNCPDCETSSDYSDRSFKRDNVCYRRWIIYCSTIIAAFVVARQIFERCSHKVSYAVGIEFQKIKLRIWYPSCGRFFLHFIVRYVRYCCGATQDDFCFLKLLWYLSLRITIKFSFYILFDYRNYRYNIKHPLNCDSMKYNANARAIIVFILRW